VIVDAAIYIAQAVLYALAALIILAVILLIVEQLRDWLYKETTGNA